MKYFTAKTFEELRKEYKKLALLHHPDRGGKTEIMQEINAEYDRLFEELKNIHNAESANDITGNKKHMNETPEAYRKIIMSIISIEGIIIELCGSWLWISGNTYIYKEQFKKLGFDWSKNKKMWYWKPEEENNNWFYRGKKSIDSIRKTYGSEIISTERPFALT